MKVKRIGTEKTLRQYEKILLEKVFPAYLSRSRCTDTPQEILADIRFECHNPMFFSCVVLNDEDVPVGFLMARVVIGKRGKQAFIDHLHAPNIGMSSQLVELVLDKLQADNVMWITYRDPAAWIRFSEKQKFKAELHGWVLRLKEE